LVVVDVGVGVGGFVVLVVVVGALVVVVGALVVVVGALVVVVGALVVVVGALVVVVGPLVVVVGPLVVVVGPLVLVVGPLVLVVGPLVVVTAKPSTSSIKSPLSVRSTFPSSSLTNWSRNLSFFFFSSASLTSMSSTKLSEHFVP
jgi:hypothetical protein